MGNKIFNYKIHGHFAARIFTYIENKQTEKNKCKKNINIILFSVSDVLQSLHLICKIPSDFIGIIWKMYVMSLWYHTRCVSWFQCFMKFILHLVEEIQRHIKEFSHIKSQKKSHFFSYVLKNGCDLLGDLFIATGQLLHK